MIEDFKITEHKDYGYKHVSPLPSQEYLNEFYQKKYYDEAHDYYLNRAQEQSEWLDLTHDFRLDLIKKFIPETGTYLKSVVDLVIFYQQQRNVVGSLKV